ncbi:MAG: rod shape-determining protein MreC [Holophagales bacterium]|nr:MAG: rod shape-determining protein MreC [Holophagales bacterium]
MNPRISRALLFALLGAQLALLTWQVRRQGERLGLLEELSLRALAPAARGVQAVSSTFGEMAARSRQRRELITENEQLQTEVRELRRDRLRLHALEREVDRLSAAVDYQRASPYHLRIAEVVFADHSALLRTLVVFAGAGGARANQPVVTEAGLVGRVLSVAGDYARVQLITDRAASLGAVLERGERQGVLRGGAEGRLELDFVPRQIEVEVGDRVLTAGIDGVFPPGLPIGTVIEVTPGSELFHRIVVAPAVDFRRLDQVLLLDYQAPPRSLVEASRDAGS